MESAPGESREDESKGPTLRRGTENEIKAAFTDQRHQNHPIVLKPHVLWKKIAPRKSHTFFRSQKSNTFAHSRSWLEKKEYRLLERLLFLDRKKVGSRRDKSLRESGSRSSKTTTGKRLSAFSSALFKLTSPSSSGSQKAKNWLKRLENFLPIRKHFVPSLLRQSSSRSGLLHSPYEMDFCRGRTKCSNTRLFHLPKNVLY